MKLLVTGGAGFIGSNFINYMLKKYPDYLIINLDALTYASNLENLREVSNLKNYQFIKGDITDGELVDKLVSDNIDVIVNFAAESHVDRSIVDPHVFIHTNIQGTHALLEAARKYSIQKYIQISTDEVYGTLSSTGLFSEDCPLAPNSPYSASKASADLLVRSYYKTYGLPAIVTRCSNNYGPYQFPEKLIPLMIIKAIHNEPLPIYGNGLNVRDWLHVEDHCRALDLVVHYGREGEVYNIGGNNEKTNLDIVKIILSYLGKPESLITFVQDRPGHDFRYAIDASKIKLELNWEPVHTFESGIRETIEWYIKNEDWWRVSYYLYFN